MFDEWFDHPMHMNGWQNLPSKEGKFGSFNQYFFDF